MYTDEAVLEHTPVRRERRRRDSLKIRDKSFRQEIASRVIRFAEEDDQDRSESMDMRLQRYAKFRQWTEGKNWPWPEASDIAFPDIMTHSLRVQDTLHNAVMAVTPPVSARAKDNVSREKQETVDQLHQFQLFTEQPGEDIVGKLADSFVNDGHFVAFIPWIDETREVSELGRHDPIPENADPVDYFSELIQGEYPRSTLETTDGWDWKGRIEGRRATVSFYTNEEGVEMVTRREAMVFQGPRVIPLLYEDVLTPPGCENLQIPGPSNPKGAQRVTIRQAVTVDEVLRLVKSGYYDLVPDDFEEKLRRAKVEEDEREQTKQRKDFQGEADERSQIDSSHQIVTRLVTFDTYDIDGDGVDEDVIWWTLEETQTLLRARMLTEVFPGSPPRRPFAEAQMIPVQGSRTGIGLPEMMEGLHDAMKMILDQLIDAGSISIAPFFFYRPTSNMKNEVIRYSPGEGYPLQNPREDVNIPNIQSPGQALALNLLTILGASEERLTMVSDLSLGRVPAGKASALRTVGGMSLVAGQGEARPERVLRRFFMGFCQIYEQMHRLNAAFLPNGKLIKIVGQKDKSAEIFKPIERRDQISGQFQFTFGANVFNTGRQQMQQALGSLMPVLISDIAFQMGISDQKTVFNLITDFVKAWGQESDRYVNKPSPDLMKPRITAEDAISAMMNSVVPDGIPAEGAQAHLQKLLDFSGLTIGGQGLVDNPFDEPHPNFGLIDPSQLEIFSGYTLQVAERAQQEAQQQALQQAAQQFQGPQAQQQAPDNSQAPVQENELMDETLPTAGGGGAIA